MGKLLCHFDFSSAAIQIKLSIHFSLCFAEIFLLLSPPSSEAATLVTEREREREKLSIRLSDFVSQRVVPSEAAAH